MLEKTGIGAVTKMTAEEVAILSSALRGSVGVVHSPADTRKTFARVFDLLILARNSHDEEALQEAIDIVAEAAGDAE